jgi:hypothetical protein
LTQEEDKGHHYTCLPKEFFCDLILDQKEIGMEFKKGIIISSKTMYKNKVFLALGT